MIRLQDNSVIFKDDKDVIQGTLKSTATATDATATLEAQSGSNEAAISVTIDKAGTAKTAAPSPADSSNDDSIATTAWVKTKISQASLSGGSTPSVDLSNYVDKTSEQTITGSKTFDDIKAKTPNASDSSTKVATTAWVKAKIDTVSAPDLSGYVAITGDQTITGSKTFSSVVKAKTPASDADDTSVATTAWVKAKVGTGSVDTSKVVDLTSEQTISGAKTFAATLKASSPNVNADDTSVATTAWVNTKIKGLSSADMSNYVDLKTAQTISGAKTFSSVTKSTTPASGSDDTSVATTAWVNAKVKGLTSADMSNYVDLGSAQTITGVKTFNATPLASSPNDESNDNSVATTAWVTKKLSASSGSGSNEPEAVKTFSADMTIDDSSATYSILTSASKITVAKGTDAKGWSKCVKIENASTTITLGDSWSWKDGSQPALTAPCLLCLVWVGNLGVAGIVSTTAS